jgi:(p)ppGpp synthase/HD superfamily hydrolase
MANKPITKREELAWIFAKEQHKQQFRKFSGLPYFDAHVQKVNGTLKLYTTDEVLLIVALLHDIIEDCFENKWVGYSIIKGLFDKEIADLVMELTSCKDELKYKYDSNKTEYLIDKMLNMSERALTVKLSDRFNNISDSFMAKEKFRNSYYKETKEITDALKVLKLNKIQQLLYNDIVAKLSNIATVFNL